MVVFTWTEEAGELRCHRTVLNAHCDWSEVDALCRKLSSLLDRHDADRFSSLLKYGA